MKDWHYYAHFRDGDPEAQFALGAQHKWGVQHDTLGVRHKRLKEWHWA